MMPEEQAEILALFECEERWCREAEASDANGEPVQFDDSDAVAWDITGAMCLLFGWPRARVLFGQLEQHITGQKRPYRYDRDPVIDAMVALQDFNDRTETTYETLLAHLRTMPVWHGAAGTPELAG